MSTLAKGYDPTDERIKALASVENKRNEQMIYIVNEKLTKKELVRNSKCCWLYKLMKNKQKLKLSTLLSR